MKTRSRVDPRALMKSRYDEARAIKAAWDVRLNRAKSEHARAVRNGLDADSERRNLAAVEASATDAAGDLKVAANLWMNHQPKGMS